ncbi:MAG: nucleoside-diphosphate sugar epimerase/dehydratase [Pseudomonadota bacterium]
MQLKNFQTIEAIRETIISMSRYSKRAVLVSSDLAVLTIVILGLLYVRYGGLTEVPDWQTFLLAACAPLITVSIYGWFGFYRVVTRFIGYRGSIRIALGTLLAMLIWALIVLMSGHSGIPRSVILAYGLFGTIAILSLRHLAGAVLRSVGIIIAKVPMDIERIPVVIYGAGADGVALSNAISRSPERELVGFVDSEPSMWRQYVNGKKVYRPDQLEEIIRGYGVKEVLLAVCQVQRRQRREIMTAVERLPVIVKVLPGMEEIASGQVTISDARPVGVEDLLGRDPIPPDPSLLANGIFGKSVMVTGAGGSVGSELVRQIIEQKPAKLVLVELSEVALYQIESDLRDRLATSPMDGEPPVIVPVLGSVLDEAFIKDTLSAHAVKTIFHAAAYKHVPMIEANVITGVQNNAIGCLTIARAAQELNVERFVLISTDKAVRPSNVMGATKRLSEMVLQALSQEPDNTTVFTMVRFGNVLDSSGSVVRRFRSQIERGGPVTVTHPNVTRYFMSIPEAAALVIQAGSLADGGDVFVLDMGDLVKIDDLARLMIRLSGHEVADEDNPDGDIAIAYTGLRPGEKLYEELLIADKVVGTVHPRIMRCHEPALSPQKLAVVIDQLRNGIKRRDVAAIQGVLLTTVEDYSPDNLVLAQDEVVSREWQGPPRTLH